MEMKAKYHVLGIAFFCMLVLCGTFLMGCSNNTSPEGPAEKIFWLGTVRYEEGSDFYTVSLVEITEDFSLSDQNNFTHFMVVPRTFEIMDLEGNPVSYEDGGVDFYGRVRITFEEEILPVSTDEMRTELAGVSLIEKLQLPPYTTDNERAHTTR